MGNTLLEEVHYKVEVTRRGVAAVWVHRRDELS